MNNNKGRTAVTFRKPNKKRAIIVCTVLAAVFIVAMAVVLMSISDNRAYNDYMNQAQMLYYNKDYDGALSALRKAASVEKTEECLLLMADCYQTQGNYTKTLEALRQMDTNKPAVASRIAEVEKLRKSQNATEKVTIAGREYPVGTTRLVLDGMGLTDASLTEVAQLYAIDSLSLANNEVRDISGLSGLGGLVTLNLTGNEIMDLGPLASLTGLRTLYLDGNPIRDFSPLYSLGNLTSLSIKDIDVTATQLSELSKALPNCAIHSEKARNDKQEVSFGGVTFDSNIADLDLSDMGIHDISAIANCQNITRLNLSGNEISDLSPLMNLPYLQWLDISNNYVSDLRPLMGISGLYFLNASGNNISSTSALTMMTGLNTLYLDENPIRDFSGLRKLRAVTTLGLNGTGLYDGALEYLSGLNTLSYLSILDNEALTGMAVEALKQSLPNCSVDHSVLTTNVLFERYEVPSDTADLTLSGLGISDISAIQQLPELMTVDLSRNAISNLYPFQYADCRFQITSLNLGSNAISDLTPLSLLTKVEYLDLSNNSITSLQALTGLSSLRSLRLSGNPLSTEEILMIRLVLPDCEVIY